MRNVHVRTGDGKRHEPCLLTNSGTEGWLFSGSREESNVDEFLPLNEPTSVSSCFTGIIPSVVRASNVEGIAGVGLPDIYEHTLSTSWTRV